MVDRLLSRSYTDKPRTGRRFWCKRETLSTGSGCCDVELCLSITSSARGHLRLYSMLSLSDVITSCFNYVDGRARYNFMLPYPDRLCRPKFLWITFWTHSIQSPAQLDTTPISIRSVDKITSTTSVSIAWIYAHARRQQYLLYIYLNNAQACQCFSSRKQTVQAVCMKVSTMIQVHVVR